MIGTKVDPCYPSCEGVVMYGRINAITRPYPFAMNIVLQGTAVFATICRTSPVFGEAVCGTGGLGLCVCCDFLFCFVLAFLLSFVDNSKQTCTWSLGAAVVCCVIYIRAVRESARGKGMRQIAAPMRGRVQQAGAVGRLLGE